MKEKEQLIDELTKKLKRANTLDPMQVTEWANQMAATYHLFLGECIALLSLKRKLSEVDESRLYCMGCIVLDHIDEYFAPQEMRDYHHQFVTSKEKKIFPFTFPISQVTPTQWICGIKSNQLLQLSAAKLLRYNPNTQRTMRRVIYGEDVEFKISVNQNAVMQIKRLMADDLYMPNTITLNMPPDTTDFSYNEETGEMTIKKIDHLDIIDGFHRYLALTYLAAENPDFDYPMELRITAYTEDQAQQMIWQEDQKTKMRKVDSNSFNHQNGAVQILSQLNADSTCSLYGMIGRNSKYIDFGRVVNAFSLIFASDLRKKSDMVKLRQSVKDAIEGYFGETPAALDKKEWPFEFCVAFMLLVKQEELTVENVNSLAQKIGTIANNKLTRGDIQRYTHLAKEVAA